MENAHASPERSRQLAERAIGEAMGELAQRTEERARREATRAGTPRDRWSRIGLAITLPALVAMVLWNVSSVRLIAVRMIGPVVTRGDLEAALEDVAADLDTFHDDYGEFPVSLTEVGMPEAGEWHYSRLESGYRLSVSMGGHTVSADR